MLRLGNHDNEYLQRAWNKYGEEAFEWSILMKCQPNEMYEWEQAFHDIMREMFGVYNIGGFVQSPRLGIKHTDESKIKISKNREYKYGVENPSYGRKWTEEQRLQHVKMNSKLTGNREVIVCEMYVSGISSLQLANQFDISRSAIDRCLKRHNTMLA
jgi:group I intron endonuclease